MRDVLEPIAEQIARQLEGRPGESTWPETPDQRTMSQIVADIICVEKCLASPPALHPDDPTELIFWGPFDDLTLLGVYFELKKQLQCQFKLNEWSVALQEHENLKDLFDYCESRMPHALARRGASTSPT